MADTWDDRDGSALGFMRTFRRVWAESLHTCMPAVVQSYDASKQMATVKLVLRARFYDADGAVTTEPYPLLADVPVQFQRFGGFVIIKDLVAGDTGMVHFSERSMDLWFANGGNDADDPIDRKHDLNDGFFVPGISPSNKPISVGVTGSLVIGPEDNSGTRIYMDGSLMSVGAPNPASFVALAAGVLARLSAIETAFNAHVHPTALGPSGPATPLIAPVSALSDVASTTLKAK